MWSCKNLVALLSGMWHKAVNTYEVQSQMTTEFTLERAWCGVYYNKWDSVHEAT